MNDLISLVRYTDLFADNEPMSLMATEYDIGASVLIIQVVGTKFAFRFNINNMDLK